jgi:isopenicillin N synthase-like dioxygenase
MKLFFKLDKETKNKVRKNEKTTKGYFDEEMTKNLKDWKEVFDFGVFDTQEYGFNQWPDQMSDSNLFKETLLEYSKELAKLAKVLLRCFSLLLGVGENFLSQHFTDPHPGRVRFNYYPECPDLTTELGVNPHRDFGVLTILKQDDSISGLQVYLVPGDESQGDGLKIDDPHWIDVLPVKGAFTVNLGEMLQVWSNDQYFAAMHRVLANRDSKRFSIPFFMGPKPETEITPIVRDGEVPHYKSINFGEYRKRKIEGYTTVLDFKDQSRLHNYKT